MAWSLTRFQETRCLHFITFSCQHRDALLGTPKSRDTLFFWEPRYHDFNVWSEAKRVEKLRYIHRNPVHRGLVERPEDWLWSSFSHYGTGIEGPVEIESQWTARKREQSGVVPRISPGSQKPHPVATCATRVGHPQQ
jgi:hypothetical protein